VLKSLSERYSDYRQEFLDHIDDTNDCLDTVGWTEGLKEIQKTSLVELLYIVDAIIVDFKYIVPIGYPIGAVMGMVVLLK